MKITKFGHCCLLIDTGGVRLLTDPGSFSTTQNEAKDVDAILITHEHADHLHVESVKEILKNNSNAKIISNSSVGNILDKEGIEYHSVSDGESINIKGVLIEGMGTKHAIIWKDFGQVENTGYFIDNKLFYPGDAFYEPGKPVDILALPVVGPWVKIGEAIYYALSVKPRVAFPVHDGPNAEWGIVANRLVPSILPKEGVEFVVIGIGETKEL